MRWLGGLALVVACAPVEREESQESLDTGVVDTGEEFEPLPELGSRVEGVTLAALRVVDRLDSQWSDLGGAYMGGVLLPDEDLLSYLTWSSTHCDVFDGVAYASSAKGLSPLGLTTSLVEATATYDDGTRKYALEGLNRSPYAVEDGLGVRYEDEVEIVVPAPPILRADALGEPTGLQTLLHIPHDDFDAVQVQLYDGAYTSGYCLYGRADMERVDGGWELPLVDAASQDMPLHARDVLVYPIHLEMTDLLFPDHPPVPVKAARGLAISATALGSP